MNITWNAENYRQGFSFVPSYGADVMQLLTVPQGSRVVDLGCGNGRLTAQLADAGYNVTGIDASESMLRLAREEYPSLRFEQGNAVTFHLGEPADAIFSNAVLHWIDADQQEQMLHNVASNLRVGGEFVFEFGGYGCAEAVHRTLETIFKEHGRVYPRVFYFPTIGEYAPLVERAGMRVEYAILFDRPTPQQDGRTAADWIRMFDVAPFAGIPEDETADIIAEADRRLEPRLCHDGTWYIDYVRIRMRGRRQ